MLYYIVLEYSMYSIWIVLTIKFCSRECSSAQSVVLLRECSCGEYSLNRQQRLTLTLTLTQKLEGLSGDGMSSTLLDAGVCATTRAVTGDLATRLIAKSPIQGCQSQERESTK